MKVKDASHLTFVPYRVPLGMDEKSIKYGIQIVIDEVSKIQERDMEEIVRCKDCISSYVSSTGSLMCDGEKVKEDFFCAYGERKDGFDIADHFRGVTKMGNEIKPCPFCGGRAHIQKEWDGNSYSVLHTCKGNYIYQFNMHCNNVPTKEMAIEAWNRRVETK